MFLNFAIPKGRIFDKTIELLKNSGFEIRFDERNLTYDDKNNEISFMLLKNHDVPLFVERGICDLGICGKDTILETGADVFEVLNLGIGYCRLSLIVNNETKLDTSKFLRIATKFPNLARTYLEKLQFELITLDGSVEIAATCKMVDAVLDLVSTGETIKRNNLKEVEVFEEFFSYLIVNKISFRLKYKHIKQIIDRLAEK
mgnify:CR=1 FL=1